MYKVIKLKKIDSTNRFLKDFCKEHQPDEIVFCLTEEQTQGYGQLQRKWVTNKNSAILSLAFPIEVKQSLTGLVSLQIARLVHQALGLLVDDALYLKWPNDLFGEKGKVAGVLIEQVLLKDYRCLVVGVGINRQADDLPMGSGAASFFDLEEFIQNFHILSKQFGVVDFDKQQLFDYWRLFDYFACDSRVQIFNAEKDKKSTMPIEGVYKGINEHGQATVLVIDDNKEELMLLLSSGLNSIRKL